MLWATYLTNKTEHAIERAYESQRACEQAIPERVQSHVKSWRGVYEHVTVSDIDSSVIVAKGPKSGANSESLIVRASCWPLGLQPKSVTGGAEYPRK